MSKAVEIGQLRTLHVEKETAIIWFRLIVIMIQQAAGYPAQLDALFLKCKMRNRLGYYIQAIGLNLGSSSNRTSVVDNH